MKKSQSLLLLLISILSLSTAFQSDELEQPLEIDEEFEGPQRPSPQIRRRLDLDSTPESKPVQFTLEHAFGDAQFAPAGTFTARLRSSSHGAQTLTKLRFSRNALSDADKEKFDKLLKEDGFYTIRLPSGVLNAQGREFVKSSVRVRCIPRESLDEHFVIHMDGDNILAVNYGSAGACQYPRLLKYPSKWAFNSYTVLKNSEQAAKTPTFAEELIEGENQLGEGVKPPEKSFWAKYWMYLIPLGLVVMNVMTQVMNMPEEGAGQAGGHGNQAAAQRAIGSGPRRR